MYKITKEFHFSASHTLKGLSATHPCSRNHGHNYKVVVTLKAEKLNPTGFVRDYRELTPIKDWINVNFDHRNLNDILGKLQPSAENIAKFLFDTFEDRYPEMVAVAVSETDKTCAIYEKA